MLWRLLSACILFAFVAGAHAEDPAPTGTDDFRPERLRDPDEKLGVHLTYNWSTVKAPGDVVWRPMFSCVNACKGKVHSNHSDCSLSCDTKCPANRGLGAKPHSVQLEAVLTDTNATFDGGPPKPNSDKLSDDFSKAGLPSSSDASWYVGHSLMRDLERTKDRKRSYDNSRFENDHFNDTPCSSRTLEMAYVRYNVTVNYSIAETKKTGGTYSTGSATTGQMFFVLLIPDRAQTRITEPAISCQCGPTQTVPPRSVPLRGGFLPIDYIPDDYAYVLNNDMKMPVTSTQLMSTVTSVMANDMNTANLTFMPPAMGELYIPAGWELQCVGGEGQNLQLQEDLHIRSGWNLFASTDGILAPKSVRVMCLEITKPEPRPDMQYRLVPPGNPLIARLSALTKAARVRGPWDQMRLWIATDAAPYEKIAKTLIPTPGPGTYVREMYRAASVGAFTADDIRYAAIMDLKLLVSKNYDPAAVRWFLAEKLKNAPDETIAWFDKATTEDWAAILDRGTVKEDEALVGILVAGLAQSGTAGATEAIQVLNRLPETHRAAVAESADVRKALASVLMGDDTAAMGTVLDWLIATKPASAGLLAAQLNENAPESLKAKARSLIGP